MVRKPERLPLVRQQQAGSAFKRHALQQQVHVSRAAQTHDRRLAEPNTHAAEVASSTQQAACRQHVTQLARRYAEMLQCTSCALSATAAAQACCQTSAETAHAVHAGSARA